TAGEARASGPALPSWAEAGKPPDQLQEPVVQADLMPMPACWEDLLQLDRTLTMGNYRSVLAAAIGRGDELTLAYLRERLTELVGDSAANALQLLSWAEEDAGDGHRLVIDMEALKSAPAVQRPKVAERLLQLGEDPKGTVQLRAAALVALETQKHLAPAAIDRL